LIHFYKSISEENVIFKLVRRQLEPQC